MSGNLDEVIGDKPQDGGKRRKNGHKMICKCPICINMKHAKRGGDIDDVVSSSDEEDYNDDEYFEFTGGEKKNGHKMMCKCPICKNMKMSKRGGDIYDDDSSSDEGEYNDGEGESSSDEENFELMGGKKKNGHKMMCKCPICKNMKMSKRGGGDTDANNVKINYETSQGHYDLYDSNRYKGGSKKNKGKRNTKKNSKGGKRRKSRKTRRNKRRSNRK